MASKNYNLSFTGYWLESSITNIPTESGIYCVYACTYFHARNTLGINELLYIGESSSVGDRIKNHDQRSVWQNYVFQNRPGETICFSFAPLSATETDSDRKRIETALISVHKPMLNTEMLLPDCLIEIRTQGSNSLLQNLVIAHPSQESSEGQVQFGNKQPHHLLH